MDIALKDKGAILFMLNIEKINQRFLKLGETILRFRWLNIILFLVIMAVAAGGLKKIRTDVDMDSWFMEDDALLAAKDRFEDIFGNNDFCAVLVEADNVFTPAILSKIREMGRELVEKVPYSDDVISLTDFEFTFGTRKLSTWCPK